VPAIRKEGQCRTGLPGSLRPWLAFYATGAVGETLDEFVIDFVGFLVAADRLPKDQVSMSIGADLTL
jgi:hypothetical protein